MGQCFECPRLLGHCHADLAHREPVTTLEYTDTALFEPAEADGDTLTGPTLPGEVAEGDTLEEARAMVSDAVPCYLESLRKEGRPLPASDGFGDAAYRVETVTVQLKAV